MRVIGLVAQNVLVDGQVMRVEPGATLDVPDERALELVRAGVVRPAGVSRETAAVEPGAEKAVLPKGKPRR